MDNEKELSAEKLCKEVNIDGFTLTITSEKIGEEEWTLSIINEHGVSSNWYEYFPTPQKALDQALLAIKKEGVEAFNEKDLLSSY
jgi:uncharacterized protein